jgi:aminoglycoside phosphotransferase (APT) family kinase protein
LPGLAEVLEPRRIATALAGALPECRDGAFRVLRCRVTPLRYRPGRRCTVQLDIHLRENKTGAITSRTLFGKVYHDVAKAKAVYGEMQMLAAATPVQEGPISLARAVAFLPDLALILQAPVEGRPLDMLFGRMKGAAEKGNQHGWNGALRAATALAALHRTGLTSQRERLIAAELARFKRRTARVSLADPFLGRRMEELAMALSTRFEQLLDWDPEVSLVHGDCKPSQFLIGPNHVALLDFDHCGMADPASDVGNFLASLRQLGARQWLKERKSAAAAARSLWLQTLEQRFLDEFCAASGRGADFRWRVRWYEAVALLRKALRSFARAPRSPLPAALVDEAWRCLATLPPAGGEPI